MRILVHDYAGHPFPTELSRSLARRGHHVTHAFATNLVTPRGNLSRQPKDSPELAFRPVAMSAAYRTNKYSFLKRAGYERDYGLELAALVAELRPDVILSGQTPSVPQWRLLRTAGSLGIPVITWVQDVYSVAVRMLARKRSRLLGELAGAWYGWLDRRCFQASASVVAITEDFRPVLRDFGVGDSRIHVVPNWASLEEISPRPRENAWSRARGLDGRFVFLYSGTLAMKHNPELLSTLAEHFSADPTAHLLVIAEGPGAEALRRRQQARALPNLELLPFQPYENMPDILGAADVAIAILEADAGAFSVPSKVLTYHAAGKPILAAMPARNLATRIIQTEGSGVCVEPGDTAGFVEAARRLKQDAALRQTMARRARAYAEREFDIGRITARFENILAEAVGGEGTRARS